MNRRQFWGILGGAAAAPFLRSRRSVAQDGGPAINPPSARALAALPTLMEVTAVPGLAVGVVQRDALVWHRFEGLADAGTKRRLAEDTLFPAASLGKPVFAHVVLRLADEGRLDLDRPLKAYVPDHAPADPRGDKVTARHVLSHSTGFRNWRNTADQPLVPDFDPGTRFQYSGEGFYYLQRAVEHAAGAGFEQVMQERLFGPLGLQNSTYAWRADTEARLVTGHSRGNAVKQPSRDFANRLLQHAQASGRPLASFTHTEIVAAMSALRPAPAPLPNFIIPNAAGSLLTTLGDYARFLNRILNPRSEALDLAASTRQQLFAPQVRINSALSWGLGWGLERVDGRDYVWHWGDNGNFKNFVLAHRPSRSAVVVFTNGNNGMRVAEALVAAASGHAHLAFDWL